MYLAQQWLSTTGTVAVLSLCTCLVIVKFSFLDGNFSSNEWNVALKWLQMKQLHQSEALTLLCVVFKTNK